MSCDSATCNPETCCAQTASKPTNPACLQKCISQFCADESNLCNPNGVVGNQPRGWGLDTSQIDCCTVAKCKQQDICKTKASSISGGCQSQCLNKDGSNCSPACRTEVANFCAPLMGMKGKGLGADAIQCSIQSAKSQNDVVNNVNVSDKISSITSTDVKSVQKSVTKYNIKKKLTVKYTGNTTVNCTINANIKGMINATASFSCGTINRSTDLSFSMGGTTAKIFTSQTSTQKLAAQSTQTVDAKMSSYYKLMNKQYAKLTADLQARMGIQVKQAKYGELNVGGPTGLTVVLVIGVLLCTMPFIYFIVKVIMLKESTVGEAQAIYGGVDLPKTDTYFI
jgi:hypothetical protein